MSVIDDKVMEQRKGKTLVELLRDSDDDGIGCCHSSLCEEAANEIERLLAVCKDKSDLLRDAYAQAERRKAALAALYADCADYIRVNNLYRGDGKPAIWNQVMLQAADVLGINHQQSTPERK